MNYIILPLLHLHFVLQNAIIYKYVKFTIHSSTYCTVYHVYFPDSYLHSTLLNANNVSVRITHLSTFRYTVVA